MIDAGALLKFNRSAACALAALAAGALVAQGAAAQQQPAQKQPPAAQKQPAAPAGKQAAPAAAAPAAGAPAAGQTPSAWVKLCEKAALQRKDKDGKELKEDKNICLTHHERLDGNTGMVLVSAAIRDVDGLDKDHLMVMVPLGMAIPAGLKAAVYTKDMWAKAQKNEKIDEKQLKPVDLKYTLCHQSGCTAEAEATKELVDQLKAGGGLMVFAINAAGQPIAFPVPLDGFVSAHAGAPVDNKVYGDARKQLMQQIGQRRAELIKKYQEQQQAQGGGAAPGSAAPTPPAAVPPPKKN